MWTITVCACVTIVFLRSLSNHNYNCNGFHFIDGNTKAPRHLPMPLTGKKQHPPYSKGYGNQNLFRGYSSVRVSRNLGTIKSCCGSENDPWDYGQDKCLASICALLRMCITQNRYKCNWPTSWETKKLIAEQKGISVANPCFHDESKCLNSSCDCVFSSENKAV